MIKGINIPFEGMPNSAGNSPDSLGSCSEGWKNDICRLAPWDPKTSETDSGLLKFYHSAVRRNHHAVFVFKECQSVMDTIFFLHEAGMIDEWGSAISASQTKGRGRFGRKWESPPGNLHAALIIPDLGEGLKDLEGVVLALGIMDFFSLLGIKTDLKWPNDMVFENTKVAGILVEKKKGLTILGLGINLIEIPGPEELRDGYVFPAGILTLSNDPRGPLSLWLDMLDFMREKISEIMFSRTRKEIIHLMEQKLLWRGEKVIVRDTSEGDVVGEIIGIGEYGGLMIFDHGRKKEIFSGTVLRQNY